MNKTVKTSKGTYEICHCGGGKEYKKVLFMIVVLDILLLKTMEIGNILIIEMML